MTIMNKSEAKSIVQSPVVLPWEIDPKASKWQWAVGFVSTRSLYDRRVWREPSDDLVASQVEKMIHFLRGSRNWVLCFSSSPSYMRRLYQYVLAAWACTTGDRAEVVDIQDLITLIFERDDERKEAVERADLLILPYASPDQVGLQAARGSISNLLMRRKAANLPTITDVFTRDRPKGKAWYINESKAVADVFGQLAYDLFNGDSTKFVYVSVPKERYNE